MKWLDGITDSMDVSLSELRVQSERDSAGQHITASTQGHRGGSTRAGLSTSKPAASHGCWLGAGCQVLSLCVLTDRWLGFENRCPER